MAAEPTKKPYYITTAIAYPNGAPHIGHAYEAIATDAIARFKRLDGYDVFFLTGTDEHGQKIQQTAAREGLTPRQLLDRNVPLFEAMVKMLECSNDDFIHIDGASVEEPRCTIRSSMASDGDPGMQTVAPALPQSGTMDVDEFMAFMETRPKGEHLDRSRVLPS